MYLATGKRDWLFDPSLLKLVHQCRRLILSEFGVKLRLSEADLPRHLAEYASKTRSASLAHTWETLKRQVPELGIEEASDEPSPRLYRGQPIMEGNGGKESTAEQSRSRQNKVIYRGQVIG
jgi:hypothetical protein